MIKEKLFRSITRLFMPELARQMDKEGAWFVPGASEGALPDYVRVEDRHSDVTLFCFSGAAILYAGMPQFEFRRLLEAEGRSYNLVFFRDVQRMGYHLTPDGKPGGVLFYEAKIRELQQQLGSRYTAAIGASGGGAAALFYGTRCGFDKVLAFSPAYALTVYEQWREWLRALFNVKGLLTEPTAYIEVLLVLLGASVLLRHLYKRIGRENCWDVLEVFTDAEKRPSTTVFHGARCRPDAIQAQMLARFPEVKVVTLPTGRHNCAAYLKNRGELGSAIMNEITP